MASTNDEVDVLQAPNRKGKARATSVVSTEETPLLGSSRRTYIPDDEELSQAAARRARRRLFTLLFTVFISTLCICLVIFLLVALLAYSYSSGISHVPPEDLLQRALVIRGPRRLDVVNVTRGGEMWLRVEVDVGLDAGGVLGISEDDEDGLFTDIWKSWGRWGVRRLKSVTADLSTMNISTFAQGETHHLASVRIPEVTIPVMVDPPQNSAEWLMRMRVPVHIVPTQNASDLLEFAKRSWRDGIVNVKTSVHEVRVHGGSIGESGWRRRFQVLQNNVHIGIHMKIPQLPGLPNPDRNSPIPDVSDMVSLEAFRVSSDNGSVIIHANASLINPFSSVTQLTVPSLPFIASLPNSTSDNSSALSSPPPIPVASVYTLPFTLSHPNTTFAIQGTVLPLPHNAAPLLSSFLSAYLTERDSPIVIHTPHFPSLQVHALFPAPRPRPHILRDVAIRNMRMTPEGSRMLVTGLVYARVVLPKGVEVDVEVEKIWPDVLVFDGEVPDEVPFPVSASNEDDGPCDSVGGGGEEDEEIEFPPPAPPLPCPLPPRAFARIRPDDWLIAHSTPINITFLSLPDDDSEEENEGGAQYTVTAHVTDVPLEVLPGRDKEFRSFVGKVVFGSQGALAGIQGVAGVAVVIDGLPVRNGDGGYGNGSGDGKARRSLMELQGLPFRGSFRVGKKGF